MVLATFLGILRQLRGDASLVAEVIAAERKRAMPRGMESDVSTDSDDDNLSDFDVGEGADSPERPRGRTKTGAGHDANADGETRRPGQQKGQRRPRGGLSPREEREQQRRSRKRPQTLDQEEQERQEQQEQRRQQKQLRRDVEGAAADEAFNLSGIIDARTTATSIAMQLQHKGCGNAGSLKPIAPRTQVGFHSIVLPFECDACGSLINIETGKRCRINLKVDSEDEEDDEPAPAAAGGGGRRRKQQKKRRKTNGRPEEILRAVVGALLSGQTYEDYRKAAIAQNLEVIHWTTFNRYLGKLLPLIEKLQNETIELVRYIVVRYATTIDSLILTHDFFWQTRGHHSRNGTGTICDRKTGGILSYRHFCQGTDSMSDRGAFEWTSAAMDPISLGEMLTEIVEWMESDVDRITEKYPEELGDTMPSLDGIILDGDASTSALVPVVMAKARAAGDTKYCGNLTVYPCMNHLGKNCGSFAAKVGHEIHKDCSCEDNLTLKGTVNQKQPKKHRGCNDPSHPLVKSYQRGLTAAVRGAKDWRHKPGYEGQAITDLVIQGVEEMSNHLSNIHDGPGFSTGKRRVCRLHDATKADGSTYTSRQFNDCGDFNRKMQSWLTTNLLDGIGDKLHPEEGGMCQNASERVGDIALQYRDKINPLGPTHYICSTGLAITHCNAIVIAKCRQELADEDDFDQRLDAFGSMESRLYDLIGLPYSVRQQNEWCEQLDRRAKRSIYRRSKAYKGKRRDGRAALTKKRGNQRSDHAYQYKGSTGGRKQRDGQRGGQGGTSKGMPGACECHGQCLRQCPCKLDKLGCGPRCHAGRSCKNLAPLQLGGPTAGSSAAGSSTAGADTSSAGAAGGRTPWAGPRQAEWPTASRAAGSTRPDKHWADAEPAPPALDATLIGTQIWFRFPAPWDWRLGAVIELNDDPAEMDDGEMANFIVEYDDADQAHDLQHTEYCIDIDAPPGSWYVIRASGGGD